MLISFTIKNWMSYRETATFSMIASKERQHGERVARVKKYQMRVLPVAAIYGGNASGKTNLFKAISFTKHLVVKGTQPDGLIPVEAFRLDSSSTSLPSEFSFQILINNTIYEFSFSVTRNAVIEEKLVQILSNNERILYFRKDGKPNFDESLDKDQFLHFAFRGTRNNQLFLTNTVNQNVGHFKLIYDWFKNTLVLVAPDSRFELFEQFLQENHPLYPVMNTVLSRLDTGIAHLGGEDHPFESLALPDSFKAKLKEELPEGTTVRLLAEPMNERFIVSRKNGELIAKKLVTYHRNVEGNEIKFEMHQESDGTRRIIDLVPAFLELSFPDTSKVYIIDEIDRSLHTLLTQELLEAYLNECDTESRSQLLLTTHDMLLMDQNLLRRDEMWVTERNKRGDSSLIAFSEYKDVRYDKDIRKSYLQGRMGGTPRFLLSAAFPRKKN